MYSCSRVALKQKHYTTLFQPRQLFLLYYDTPQPRRVRGRQYTEQ